MRDLPGMVDGARITLRLGGDQLAKLDAMADAAGISRSLALRRLVDNAHGRRQRILTVELLRLLEERAKSGSARAIRALLERTEQAERLERLRSLTT